MKYTDVWLFTSGRRADETERETKDTAETSAREGCTQTLRVRNCKRNGKYGVDEKPTHKSIDCPLFSGIERRPRGWDSCHWSIHAINMAHFGRHNFIECMDMHNVYFVPAVYFSNTKAPNTHTHIGAELSFGFLHKVLGKCYGSLVNTQVEQLLFAPFFCAVSLLAAQSSEPFLSGVRGGCNGHFVALCRNLISFLWLSIAM